MMMHVRIINIIQFVHAKNHLIHFIKIQKVVEFKYIWDKTKIQQFLPND